MPKLARPHQTRSCRTTPRLETPSSFEVHKLVITGIPGPLKFPDPLFVGLKRPAGEGPALQVKLLLRIAVALDPDIGLLADALDLFQGYVSFPVLQVVETAHG